jgi:hypothetical protein
MFEFFFLEPGQSRTLNLQLRTSTGGWILFFAEFAMRCCYFRRERFERCWQIAVTSALKIQRARNFFPQFQEKLEAP